ncbi:hypothetical protein JTB14_022017 [Gonioctena quinquepunctata]|nr:hypothetical protein JTB14_022017 [Gonioctena quinquepunctata]
MRDEDRKGSMRLQSIYESKGFSRVAGLIEQLVLIRYADCLNMDDYLCGKMDEWMDDYLCKELKAIYNEIEDGVLAASIFFNLPDYYKPLIMALENCGLELTTDLVKEKL